MKQKFCQWKYWPTVDVYKTECRLVGAQKDEYFKFCPYCGKPIEVAEVKDK